MIILSPPPSELNRFQLDLQRHVEERDALLARVDRARQQLEGLRRWGDWSCILCSVFVGMFGAVYSVKKLVWGDWSVVGPGSSSRGSGGWGGGGMICLYT